MAQYYRLAASAPESDALAASLMEGVPDSLKVSVG